ncbi:MAG TPA: transketolase, partial [Ornithinibacter sp.]|nr:transketolase [Ornithinibacter sp.]
LSVSDDQIERFRASHWHTARVDGHDPEAVALAIENALAVTDKPSLIVLKTIIAWPAPNAQNTEASHGSALGDAEVAATKELLGFDPKKTFEVDKDVLARAREVKARGKAAHKAWDKGYAAWRKANADRAQLLDRLVDGRLPDGFEEALPVFDTDTDKGLATRAASGQVLGALAGVLPELWGGSADLAESNNTSMAGEPSFIPKGKQTHEWKGGPYGRTLHFGIRENAMGMILNGIALEGLTRPYGGTFLVFSDYMRPAVRLAAIQQVPVTFVWTHDSIGLGEDGPTHQPIEHLAALRAMPGLDVVRPADANETAHAWAEILRRGRPAGIALSRQNLPIVDRAEHAKATGVAKGAYVLIDAASGTPDVVLVATGSEVQLALEARLRLEKSGVGTRVVSMPCREWFEEQPRSYQNKVLPPAVRARVSVEAGVAMGWHDLVGDSGRIISIEHFGASADAKTLFREFGFTPEAVVKAAKDSLAAVRSSNGVPSVTETAPRSRKDTGTDVPATKAPSRKSAASAGKQS